MRYQLTAFVVAAIALALVAAAELAGAAPAAVHQDFLPQVVNPQFGTATATEIFQPFASITPTVTPTPTRTPTPFCDDRHVESFVVYPGATQQQQTALIRNGFDGTITAWILVNGFDQQIYVSFYNQWQTTPYLLLQDQGILQDVVPHPAMTNIILFNQETDIFNAFKTVQVTYQACTGEWPPGVSSPTATPTQQK